MPTPLIDDDSQLTCPVCSDTFIHLEHVFVSARAEDQVPEEIFVNAVSGQVITHGSDSPTGPAPRSGRHRIALAGYCEICRSPLTLVFTQHKGVTLVEWSEATWDDEDTP